MGDAILARTPAGRWGLPEELAARRSSSPRPPRTSSPARRFASMAATQSAEEDCDRCPHAVRRSLFAGSGHLDPLRFVVGNRRCATSSVGPPTHFPIVAGQPSMGTDGPRAVPGTRCESWGLGMVARDGIEPTTRGFSVARRARFGAGKAKKRNEFSRHRPNRTPDRAHAEPCDGRPADRTQAAGPCGSWSWPHRDRAGTEPRAESRPGVRE